jgi:alpha-tubulin suppressor-like RCC1 family protein
MKDETPECSSPPGNNFINISEATDGSGHSVGITRKGDAYTWTRCSNKFGQLGRTVRKHCKEGKIRTDKSTPRPVTFSPNGDARADDVQFVQCFAGGTKESGHTALVDSTGRRLWLAGCDRWQQLGLGSSSGGSAGYAWKNGAIWNSFFQQSSAIRKLMHENDTTIRDVALGADHTVVLSSDQKTVYTFGRGEHGQLGVVGKPFVSAPQKATKLSSNQQPIASVCAPVNCSLTLDAKGKVIDEAGQCRNLSEAIETCRREARHRGLLTPSTTDGSIQEELD